MGWMGALGSLAGGLLSSGASSNAASQQAAAANAATQAQMSMFATQNQQQAPYRQAGYNALNQINKGFGLPQTPEKYNLQDFIDYQIRSNPDIPMWQAQTDAASQLAKYNADPTGDADVAKWGGFRDLTLPTDPNGVDSGYFSHQFDASDLQKGLAPNYDFQLAQGQGAARNAGNLQTGLISGNTMKGLEDYTQNYASGAYQQAFNNYTANQSNIFNRLSNIAGLGSAANQQSAGLAGSLAPSIAGTIQGAGAAQAAGTVGSANALSGGLNNALGWYTLSNLTNPSSGGNSFASSIYPGAQ